MKGYQVKPMEPMATHMYRLYSMLCGRPCSNTRSYVNEVVEKMSRGRICCR